MILEDESGRGVSDAIILEDGIGWGGSPEVGGSRPLASRFSIRCLSEDRLGASETVKSGFV